MTPLTVNEKISELRRPFAVQSIKMKPQATTGEGEQMKGLVTYYVDARLAAARLNHMVGADGWSDEYDVLIRNPDAVKVGIPVECRLTVLGITRCDVGQISPGECDEKAWKSAYSDAFKRAAVKFEIAAYLYGSPQVWAPVKVGRNGKAQGFSPQGIAQARDEYQRWISSARIRDLYGEPLDHGDAGDEEESAHEAQRSSPPPSTPASDAQKKFLNDVIDRLHKAGAIDRGTVEAACRKEHGCGLDDITKDAAAQLLKRLVAFEEKVKAETSQAEQDPEVPFG